MLVPVLYNGSGRGHNLQAISFYINLKGSKRIRGKLNVSQKIKVSALLCYMIIFLVKSHTLIYDFKINLYINLINLINYSGWGLEMLEQILTYKVPGRSVI